MWQQDKLKVSKSNKIRTIELSGAYQNELHNSVMGRV